MEILMWIVLIICSLYLVISVEEKRGFNELYRYEVSFSFDSLIPALLLAACAVGIFK